MKDPHKSKLTYEPLNNIEFVNNNKYEIVYRIYYNY